MNDKYIRSVKINWLQIDPDSYLQNIHALRSIDTLTFEKNITLFVGENGLYLMDEPEAALSPQRQLTLLIQISKMAQAGSQFIIASHSPIILGIPDADIISFDNNRLHHCAYKDTESYRTLEMFINNRQRLLDELLKEE